MKKLINLLLVCVLTAVVFSCGNDEIAATVSNYDIEDNDLIQITNSQPFVPIDVKAAGSDMEITVTLTPEGSDEVAASNTLHKITKEKLNRVTINVPFPLPDEGGPSGKYTVNTSVKGGGKTVENIYSINILNNSYRVITCAFPTLELPAGKNVWVKVTAPETTGGDDLYAVGSFNGWNPGDPAMKMTRIPGTTCFYIALSLTNDDLLKFTRGNWGSVMKNGVGVDYKGSGFTDPDGNIDIGSGPFSIGSGELKFTVDNWADNVVIAPAALPNNAIKTGTITTVVNVNENTDDKYYLVDEDATNLEGAIELIKVEGTTSRSAFVPKVASTKYKVVKSTIEKVGLSAFGSPRIVSIDGVTNPTIGPSVYGFATEFTPYSVPVNLYITGASFGWSNPISMPAGQTFTKIDATHFEIVVTLASGSGYLFLPVAGEWDAKYGMGGLDRLQGNVIPQGPDFLAPVTEGGVDATYKIEVEFEVGTFKLTKQL